MATPADKRLLELTDKWLSSLELHLNYSSLDDDSYWKMQQWVPHQRPSRWVIELAKQKTLALKAQIEERIGMGDARFADTLELTIFLANLVGSQHIERFIPLAEPDGQPVLPAAPLDAPELATTVQRARLIEPAADATVTREMPQFLAPQPRTPPPASPPSQPSPPSSSSPPAGAEPRERSERKAPAVAGKSRGKAPAKTTAPASAPATASAAARALVLADAERLVQWGRKWYELPELIARMADRPPLPEVRRILKDNKTLFDKKSGRQ